LTESCNGDLKNAAAIFALAFSRGSRNCRKYPAGVNELLSIQNDKTAAVVFRLLEKNITARIWYLEQMLAATEELSNQLNTPGDR